MFAKIKARLNHLNSIDIRGMLGNIAPKVYHPVLIENKKIVLLQLESQV